MTLALAIFAIALGVGGVVQFFVRRERMALRARVAGTALTSVAALPAAGLVRIVGQAKTPSPSTSELTAEPVILERVTIERCDANGKYSTVEEALFGGDFEIEDSSGTLGVALGAMELRVPISHTFERGVPPARATGKYEEPTDAVIAWVAARGHTIAPSQLRVVVRAVRIDDAIMIAGAAHEGRLQAPTGRPLVAAAADALGSKWDRLIVALLGSFSVTFLLVAALRAVA